MRTPFGGGPYPIQYAKDEYDTVHLRGMVYDRSSNSNKGIASDVVFADLPEGFRPPAAVYVPVTITRGDDSLLTCNIVSLKISPNGELLWMPWFNMPAGFIAGVVLNLANFSIRRFPVSTDRRALRQTSVTQPKI